MKKARVDEERARKAEIRAKKAEESRGKVLSKLHPVVQLLVESHQHLQHPLGQKLLPVSEATDLHPPKHLMMRLTSMFVVHVCVS